MGALVTAARDPGGMVVGGVGGGLFCAGIAIGTFDRLLAETADGQKPDPSAQMLGTDLIEDDAVVAVLRAHNAELVSSSLRTQQARRLTAALRGKA